MVKKEKELGAKLFALADVDSQAVKINDEKRYVEGRLHSFQVEGGRRESIKNECQSILEEKVRLRKQEESLLAAEEMKILERRKQLNSIGGAKAAKIIERELEISARSLQMLEERVSKAIEEEEKAQKRLDLIVEAIGDLETKIASEKDENLNKIKDCEAKLLSLKKEREVIVKDVSHIDDRLVSLYERLRGRYPGDPVAVAFEGSCRSCFRALPHQLFNLILAGNSRIQCPGCSRILVLSKESNVGKAA